MKLQIFVVAFALVSGCATPSYQKVDLNEVDLVGKPLSVINDVPFVEQTQQLCGPTALYMAMKGSRPELTLEEVTHFTFTPAASGSYKQDMLAGARRMGMAPYKVESLTDIFNYSAEGLPIILFHKTRFMWKSFWHYSVLTGYNRVDEKFTLHIGSYAHHETDISDLISSWAEGGRWAYVVLSPEKLPERATLEEAIDNTLAFLRLGLNEAAYSLSKEASQRWPERYEVDVLLAETLLKRNDRKAAVLSLKRASRKNPESRELKRKIAELAPG